MLVHGFDIPLKEQETFDRVHRNATEVESYKPCSAGS